MIFRIDRYLNRFKIFLKYKKVKRNYSDIVTLKIERKNDMKNCFTTSSTFFLSTPTIKFQQ